VPYGPFTIKSGVQLVHESIGELNEVIVDDGVEVTFVPEDKVGELVLPDRLHAFLNDLRVLRRLPLCYLVPDAGLLPPESIRFFNVDRTWVDRVIDGVLTVGATGTVEYAYSYGVLRLVRQRLDADLEEAAVAQVPATTWKGRTGAMTGMLVRSELVRRWPDMIVEARTKQNAAIPVLRSEPISRDIYISIFAGSPGVVRVREPHTGLRFGVEEVSPGVYEVDGRQTDGARKAPSVEIKLRSTAIRGEQHRVIDVKKLSQKVGPSRMVALHLEQRPYVQEFVHDVPEPQGSRAVDSFPDKTLGLRRGSVDLSSLQQRAQRMQEAGQS
jgi:hypothetical protein